MPKKSSKVMRTLIIDNGSKYLSKVNAHVKAAAKEQGIKHKVTRMGIDELQAAYDAGNAGVVKGFDYVISSGSGKYRKSDTKMHEFVADNIGDATFLGVCHGAQQYAVAHGAELKKGDYMHHGQRNSKIKSKNSLVDDIAEGGEMTNYGHHKWFLPSKKAGSKLEIIAEAESPTGERFVEMYRVKGKEHYGVQFHPEQGKGEIIKRLFEKAAKKEGIPGYAKIGGYRRSA